jgi:hypothetical protein
MLMLMLIGPSCAATFDPPAVAAAGTPLREENAKVAIVIPISRCIVAPFMVPAHRG